MFDSSAGRAAATRSRAPKPAAINFSSATFCFLLLSSTLLFAGVGAVIGYYIVGGPAKLAATSTTSSGSHAARASSLPSVPKARDPAPTYTPICTDTCGKAKNGVCEDGRKADSMDMSGVGARVYCDLGTDCSDCGAWGGARMQTEPKQPQGPIGSLIAEQHVVKVKSLETVPPMYMAYTDPKLDLDVSDVLERAGIIEGGITQIFHEVLRSRCIRPDGTRALVLDVGANFGYFSVYAALHGCRVVAWEPVPLFRSFIRYNLQINNVSHLVQLRDRVVGAEDGTDVEMMVPKQGIWGTASVAGINQFLQQVPTRILVQQERIDTVIKQDVLLVKVDVEGYETMVIRSMAKLVKKHLIENYILEYSPGIAERLYPKQDLLEETPQILINLLKGGYRVMQLNDNYGKAGHVDWDLGIPALPEVTLDQLWYDLRDAKRYREGLLGCPKPPEMAGFAKYWSDCNVVPEDLHPKSFHSMFAYNTNIWAAHAKAPSRALMKASETVGVMALDQDASKTWTSLKRPDNGMAMRVCFYLEPHALVRSRCNCSWAQHHTPEKLQACKAEEETLQQMIKEGKMPYEK